MKGFFVTTGRFTLMAERAAEGNPRIELIDGVRLVQYYRQTYGDAVPTLEEAPQTIEQQNGRQCPQCGGHLEVRTAHRGEHVGQQFWGCLNFPTCRYIENIQ